MTLPAFRTPVTASLRRALTILLAAAVLGGCYRLRGSSGGGETTFTPPRRIAPQDVALPEGYRIEAVATGLTFPTGIAFDADGRAYVVEAGYAYGPVYTTPRLLRLEPGGTPSIVATGDNPPWNGVAYHDGAFYVAGGHDGGGQLLRIGREGTITPLVEGLPSYGDHHTNGPVPGPDGYLYFGQGTVTNAGVVGPDNADYGWLEKRPEVHDVPCRDVVLTGRTFRSENPLTPDPDDRAETGAYVPFGTATRPGKVIPGRIPCGGAVFRVRPTGGAAELVAWGFRNPFGLAFSPSGRLHVTDNGYDERGSRPVWGTGDLLFAVTPGTWYGWPDYSGGVPFRDDAFEPPGKDAPGQLLATHPNDPPAPVAQLGVHSSSNGLDFSRSDAFGYAGDAFIAQLGDMAPSVGKVLHPVGFQVVRVDVARGVVHGFAANRGRHVAPASRQRGGGLERPVAVRFSPDGRALYVVDFGVITVRDGTVRPYPETGVVWRISREEAP